MVAVSRTCEEQKMVFLCQLLQPWLMPTAVWLFRWDGMCCRPKVHSCRNSKFFLFESYSVGVCSKGGKGNKELQPAHLCSEEGFFSCLHTSCSKSHKDFASNHIVPLFIRAELLFPSCLVPAGFVCKVPRIPPPANFSEDLGCSLPIPVKEYVRYTVR